MPLPLRISFENMKARWAYSELDAERFTAWYEPFRPKYPTVFEQKQAKIPFDDLTSDEQDSLVEMNEYARGALQAQLTRSDYELQYWTREHLSSVYALSQMCGGQYRLFAEFAATPPDPSNPGDPRKRATQCRDPFQQTDPVIVSVLPHGHTLVEGYTRSLHFWRYRNPAMKLLAWVAAPAS
jgi:hypothetical protein